MTGLYTSWTDISSKYQKAASIGAWVLTGGRWFHMNTSSDTQENMYSTIQGSYDLVNATATLTQSMKAGRYMFGLDMKGYYMAGSAKSVMYTPNYESTFYGATIFANGDTTVCDTLPTRYYDTYFKFFDAAEGDNNVVVGATWTIPDDMVGKKLGGKWFLANDQLRLLGTTTEEQTRLAAIENIKEQQRAMVGYIEILDSLYNLDCTVYPWGKEALKDSLDALKARYEESLSVVDAEGKYLPDADEPYLTDESGAVVAKGVYYNTLVAYNKNANSARSTFFSTNKPYTTLVADLAKAKEVYNNTSGSDSKKTALKSEIENSQSLVDAACSMTADDAESFTSADEALIAAQQAYENSAATYTSPSKVNGANMDFSSGTSNWTYTLLTNAKAPGTKTNVDFESGYNLYFWRGNTVSPNAKVLHDAITTTDGGIYEYRAKGYALNDKKAYDLAIRQVIEGVEIDVDGTTQSINDTIFDAQLSKVMLVFGASGTPDSTSISSRKLQWDSATDGYIPTNFSVFFVGDAGTALEFGAIAESNVAQAGSNAWGFGDNEIFYYGEDISGTVSGVKSDLQTELATAKEMNAKATGNLLVDWRVRRMVKAIERAEEALATATPSTSDAAAVIAYCKLLQNARWNLQVNEVIADPALGIGSISADEAMKQIAAKGVYNLQGVKVADAATTFDNLPAGLYIINGKKYIKQ